MINPLHVIDRFGSPPIAQGIVSEERQLEFDRISKKRYIGGRCFHSGDNKVSPRADKR